MAGVFIYADTLATAAPLAGFAKATGKECCALAFSQEVADAIASCGASEILLLQGEGARPEDYAKATAALLEERGAEMLLCISTATGRELASSVAGICGVELVSDASTLSFDGDSVSATRMVYGGLVEQSETISGFVVATCGAGIAEPASGAAAITPISAQADTRVKVIAEEPIQRDSGDLANAERVVCVGNGVAKQEDLIEINDLAKALEAGVVCTRGIAEERKWLPVEAYVGISGLNLNAKLYLSLGVSGAIQHTYGMRNVKYVVAVDSNENAPIASQSDYMLVGDLYDILPELIKVFS